MPIAVGGDAVGTHELEMQARRTFVAQGHPADWGVASLAAILRFYGYDLSLTMLGELTGKRVGGGGLLSDVVECCESLGLKADVSRSAVEQLVEVDGPRLLHVVRDGHAVFAVYYGSDKSVCVLGDPGLGVRLISVRTLARIWLSGIVVTLKPTAELPERMREVGGAQSIDADLRQSQIAHRRLIEKAGALFERLDDRQINEDLDQIWLFAVVRNESLRLPYFLDYYFRQGVDRILLIDNGSTDTTCDIALARDNVHVFRTLQPYRHHWNWVEHFLARFGLNRWCVVVDADELLVYPSIGKLTIRDITEYLRRHRYTALPAILLDAYSARPIAETECPPGTDPIVACPYFDPFFDTRKVQFLDKKNGVNFVATTYWGGMRRRVFGLNPDQTRTSVCVSKVPLFRNTPEAYLCQGMHAINNASLADVQGALFHTKFLSDFPARVGIEAQRQEHYNDACEYKLYEHHLASSQHLTLYDPRCSVRYEEPSQLTDLGIMRSSAAFESFVERLQ